jgi:hypothetical protein
MQMPTCDFEDGGLSLTARVIARVIVRVIARMIVRTTACATV